MQIKPSINYDKGTKSFSGFISDEFNCENENSVASHLLVYMLRSLYSDNKLVTAYYLTGKSIDGTNFWRTTKQVISTIEENKKFKVHSVVTDMGPSNRAMWRAANIHSDRDSTSCFTVHPNDSQRSLFFLADPTHLIKSLRNLLLKNNIILPKDYKENNGLNSEIVTFDCVKFLVNFQEKSSFKLQPKLSSVNVNPT